MPRTWLVPTMLSFILLTGCAATPSPTSALPTPPSDVTSGPELSTATPVPASSPTAALPALNVTSHTEPTGPCDHQLWPLRDGASWNYQWFNSGEETHATLSTSVTGQSATLTFDGASATFTCDQSGLRGVLPGLVGHSSLGAGITGLNPRGAFLPNMSSLSPLGTEATWDIELDARGVLTLPEAGGGITVSIVSGTLVLVNTTQPLTEITTPAGTFLALPIMQSMFLDAEVSNPDGSHQHVLISAAAQLYLAEGIGLIKLAFGNATVTTPGSSIELPAGPTLALISAAIP